MKNSKDFNQMWRVCLRLNFLFLQYFSYQQSNDQDDKKINFVYNTIKVLKIQLWQQKSRKMQ